MTATSVEYSSERMRRPNSVKPLACSKVSGTRSGALRRRPSMGAGPSAAGTTSWVGSTPSVKMTDLLACGSSECVRALVCSAMVPPSRRGYE